MIFVIHFVHTTMIAFLLNCFLFNNTGSPFIASVKDISNTADSEVRLQSICVSTNTDTHGKYLNIFS